MWIFIAGYLHTMVAFSFIDAELLEYKTTKYGLQHRSSSCLEPTVPISSTHLKFWVTSSPTLAFDIVNYKIHNYRHLPIHSLCNFHQLIRMKLKDKIEVGWFYSRRENSAESSLTLLQDL